MAVTPASASVAPGSTVQLTATARDAAGNVLPGRPMSWASNNTSVATVNGSGLVTAVVAGRAMITATSEGVDGTMAKKQLGWEPWTPLPQGINRTVNWFRGL